MHTTVEIGVDDTREGVSVRLFWALRGCTPTKWQEIRTKTFRHVLVLVVNTDALFTQPQF